MKKLIIALILFTISLSVSSQDQKLRPILWTTHSQNTDIVGVSVGIFPKEIFRDTTLTRTFGVRIEAPGLGLFFPLIPRSPISRSLEAYENAMNNTPNEIVYGINISSGSNYQTEIHGVSLALIGQYIHKINGITIAGLGNITERYNGITISGLENDSFKTNGMAVSLVANSSQYFNGVQVSAQNFIKTKGTGIQIGIYNEATNFKGIQLGLWNKNDKRILPFINWNFKK
ncbi:MAG: hypothetical protein JXR05_06150 [Flavobacteriaceae bacterium]